MPFLSPILFLAPDPLGAERELLEALRRTPGSTVRDLLQLLYGARTQEAPPASTLRSRLQSLVARKLVVRRHDGREWRYCLTEGLGEGDCYRFGLVQGHTMLAVTLIKRASWTLTELHDHARHLGTKKRLLDDLNRFQHAELVQGPVGEAPQRFAASPRLRSILRDQGVENGDEDASDAAASSLVLLLP
jgi:hypothetical protein